MGRLQELLDRLNASNRSLNKRIARNGNLETLLTRLDTMKECIDEIEELIRMEIERREMIKS